jgi:hypothetical protein
MLGETLFVAKVNKGWFQKRKSFSMTFNQRRHVSEVRGRKTSSQGRKYKTAKLNQPVSVNIGFS